MTLKNMTCKCLGIKREQIWPGGSTGSSCKLLDATNRKITCGFITAALLVESNIVIYFWHKLGPDGYIYGETSALSK